MGSDAADNVGPLCPVVGAALRIETIGLEPVLIVIEIEVVANAPVFGDPIGSQTTVERDLGQLRLALQPARPVNPEDPAVPRIDGCCRCRRHRTGASLVGYLQTREDRRVRQVGEQTDFQNLRQPLALDVVAGALLSDVTQ